MNFSSPVDLALIVALVAVAWRIYVVLGARNPGSSGTVRTQGMGSQNNQTSDVRAATESIGADNKSLETADRGLQEGLARIRKREKDFDLQHFTAGAERAYEIILTAFAEGDRKNLQPLLGSHVLDEFLAEIADRQESGRRLTFSLVRSRAIEPLRIEVQEKLMRITVRFTSEMIFGLSNADGQPVDGHVLSPKVVQDIWTFERSLVSRDPNWLLVATEDELG